MKKIGIAIVLAALLGGVAGQAQAGTKETQPKPAENGKKASDTLPKGLLNALDHANPNGIKGIENAIEQKYKSRGV